MTSSRCGASVNTSSASSVSPTSSRPRAGRDALGKLEQNAQVDLDHFRLEHGRHRRADACCKVIRKHPKTQAMPFIMATGRSDKEQVKEAISAGVNNYIIKPFDASTMKKRIEAVIGALAQVPAAYLVGTLIKLSGNCWNARSVRGGGRTARASGRHRRTARGLTSASPRTAFESGVARMGLFPNREDCPEAAARHGRHRAPRECRCRNCEHDRLRPRHDGAAPDGDDGDGAGRSHDHFRTSRPISPSPRAPTSSSRRCATSPSTATASQEQPTWSRR